MGQAPPGDAGIRGLACCMHDVAVRAYRDVVLVRRSLSSSSNSEESETKAVWWNWEAFLPV